MRKTKFLFSCFLLFGLLTNAQCAMCRAQLESMEDNVVAEGVNNGIIYLMIIPYILLFFVGFAIYKLVKNKKQNV